MIEAYTVARRHYQDAGNSYPSSDDILGPTPSEHDGAAKMPTAERLVVDNRSKSNQIGPPPSVYGQPDDTNEPVPAGAAGFQVLGRMVPYGEPSAKGRRATNEPN